MALDEVHALLRYVYTGQLCQRGGEACQGDTCRGGDLERLEPSLAMALLPHACVLLMDGLKRLCEAGPYTRCTPTPCTSFR